MLTGDAAGADVRNGGLVVGVAKLVLPLAVPVADVREVGALGLHRALGRTWPPWRKVLRFSRPSLERDLVARGLELDLAGRVNRPRWALCYGWHRDTDSVKMAWRRRRWLNNVVAHGRVRLQVHPPGDRRLQVNLTWPRRRWWRETAGHSFKIGVRKRREGRSR
eukprot:3204272-Alexandrium_andersonii.AAC.1